MAVFFRTGWGRRFFQAAVLFQAAILMFRVAFQTALNLFRLPLLFRHSRAGGNLVSGFGGVGLSAKCRDSDRIPACAGMTAMWAFGGFRLPCFSGCLLDVSGCFLDGVFASLNKRSSENTVGSLKTKSGMENLVYRSGTHARRF